MHAGYYEDKVAVITGGGTGIGRALALALGRNGAVLVLASTNGPQLERTAGEITAAGGRAEATVCDVADAEAVRSLAGRVKQAHGRVDLLFANAGVTTSGPFLEHRPGDWDWIYDVVLRGVTHCVEQFYPQMVEQGHGQIVITGSQAGLVPDWVIGHGPYTSAKAAVTALAVALRPEAAEHGVGVSLIIPAGVETDILNSDRSRAEKYGRATKEGLQPRVDAPPFIDGTRFMLTPDEVAEIVLPAVARNEPFIVTHGGLKPLAEEYFARILSAYDAALARERDSPQGGK